MKYVYLLQSLKRPHRTYTGISRNYKARIIAHNAGLSGYPARFRPWKTVVVVRIEDDLKAEAFERYLKSGSGQAFVRRHFL